VLPDGNLGEIDGRTQRPAFLFAMEPSHDLRIDAPEDANGVADAAFLTHAIAFLYGTRLQLDGWSFDGRIPKTGSYHNIVFSPKQAESFIANAYREWKRLSSKGRSRMTNILYMHCRTPSYDWPWERFMHEYMVTDAVHRHLVRNGDARTSSNHAERIIECCRILGVWCNDQKLIDNIVAQRNELTHEAMWEGRTPGHHFSVEGYSFYFLVRSLNHRLIGVLLGGKSLSYFRSQWTNWHAPQALK
jgi:hypothetical protein